MAYSEATRRTVLGGLAGLIGLNGARAATPALPSEAVSLNVVDVAGQLQLTQRAMDGFAKANPKLVSKMSYSQAPAPELPGKIKAQQDAGRVDIDLVLTGTDALSAGIDQKMWVPLATGYTDMLPDLNTIYQPGALKMQALAQGQAVCVVFSPRRSAAGVYAGRCEGSAKDGEGPAGLDPSAPQTVPICAPGQFGSGADVPAGPAVYPGRFQSKGPKRRLGENLDVSG